MRPPSRVVGSSTPVTSGTTPSGGPQAGVSRAANPAGRTMIHVSGRRIRRALLLITSTAALLLALPAAPAAAGPAAAPRTAPSADLDCTITVTTELHPGVILELQHVAVTSHDLTGTADSTGTIDGQSVAVRVTFGNTLAG